jgi:hypothetical protein
MRLIPEERRTKVRRDPTGGPVAQRKVAVANFLHSKSQCTIGKRLPGEPPGGLRATASPTTTLVADVRDDIVGYALCANREVQIGRSTLARNGIHRRSASSGCTPLGMKANHREPRQQPRLYDEAPNASFPVVANRRSSAVNRPAR